MDIYPGVLPLPLLAGYSLNQESNLIRTELTTGRARQRRRFVSVPSTATATFLFNAGQAAIFEGWITHALHGGSVGFNMNLKTPLGMRFCTVKFITNPLEKCAPISPTLWQYQAQIEVEQRPIMTEQETANALASPNNAEAFINGVNTAINNY